MPMTKPAKRKNPENRIAKQSSGSAQHAVSAKSKGTQYVFEGNGYPVENTAQVFGKQWVRDCHRIQYGKEQQRCISPAANPAPGFNAYIR